MDDDESAADFADAEEEDFDSDWLALDVDAQAEFDGEWMTYLAQTDPPDGVEGFDASLSDYEGQGEQTEVRYG